MQSVEFQSEVVTAHSQSVGECPSHAQERSFESLLTDTEVAETLAVGKDWVRLHAKDIPGFRPLGMYFRFHAVLFYQWLGGSEHLLLADEVAKLLRIPKSWVYANADQIPGVLRLGRYVRFRPAVIKQFLGGSEVAQ